MSNNGVNYGITIRTDGGQDAAKEAQIVRNALGDIDKEATAAAAGADKLSAAIAKIGHYGAAYLGVSQIAGYGQAVVQTQVAMDRFNASIAIATGSAANAAGEFDHIRDLSNRLGSELMSTANAYASFSAAARGTSMEGQKARDVFDSVAGITAKMGLNADQSGGVFMALSQMMSKGVVSAEEFRQQLGERLPIATEAGARAMKVTTAEFTNMLNSGKLLSEDFLPKFAVALDEMGGSGGPVDSLQASLNRISNNFTEIRLNLADNSPLKTLADLMVGLTSHTQGLSAAFVGVTAVAASYGALRLADTARAHVVGMIEQNAALVANRAAILATAQADMAQADIALVAARANNTLGTAHAQVAAATAAHTAATVRLEAAQAASAASAGIARGALTLLGGPIGAISLALGAGAAAWMLWSDKAVESIDKLSVAQLRAERQKLVAEVAGMSHGMLSGFNEREIRAAQDQIRAIDQQINKLANMKEAAAKVSAPVEKKGKDKNASAIDGLESDAFKKQMEAMGVSAAQIKVYELAIHGASRAQLDAAQKSATLIEQLDAEKKARESATKAAEQQSKLESSLGTERAGLASINGDITLADPALSGDARIETARAIAQASEDSKYQIQVDAIARETQLMLNNGTLTEANALIQMQRMQTLEETHQAKLTQIKLKHLTAREQFERMNWTQQIGTVASSMEQMTQVGATKYRAMFEINKAAAKAKAVMNTAAGITNALSDYPAPLSFGMAALVAAEGAAQLAAINSAQFGGGGSTVSGAAASGGIPSMATNTGAPVTPTSNVTNTSSASAQTPVNITISVQALEPNSITDETRRKIADSLAPVLQQSFNRNGQNVAVMV